jgi:peptide/nickel transport system substrate-binding protein
VIAVAGREPIAPLAATITVPEQPVDCGLLVTINHKRKPFDDKRVRRALTLALDRRQAPRAFSERGVVGESAAGDAGKAHAEARRLLREAGVGGGFSFTVLRRATPLPHEPLGAWVIGQWRRIGLDVTQEVIEAPRYFTELRGGNFEVAMDFQCGPTVRMDLTPASGSPLIGAARR